MTTTQQKAQSVARKVERIIAVSNQGHDARTVLRDLAQVVFNCISSYSFVPLNLAGGLGKHADWMECELVKYKNDLESWELLGQAATEYMELVKECEPFTDVFHLIGLSSTKLSRQLGQFFTPPHLAQSLGHFTAPKLFEELRAGESISVGDISGCGSGALLLGFLRSVPTEHLEQIHVVGWDLDRQMVLTTSLQLVAATLCHGLKLGSLQVQCGNAITDYQKLKASHPDTIALLFSTNEKAMCDYWQGQMDEAVNEMFTHEPELPMAA